MLFLLAYHQLSTSKRKSHSSNNNNEESSSKSITDLCEE
jgi:hypothetical protein